MKRILIVDDEEDVLFTLEKRLVAVGYSVITATNGNDALALAKLHLKAHFPFTFIPAPIASKIPLPGNLFKS